MRRPLGLVVHDKAGERILEGLLADAGQRLRDEGRADDIRIFKRSAGPAGSSSGCQEDYLVSRGGRFGRLADILIPFLVTRQLICGAGAVVLHRAAPCTASADGRGTPETACRPRLPGPGRSSAPRDEAQAAAAGGRRLRVSVSDPTMSETTTLLRAGATDLVLRMTEAGTVLPDLTLDNPVHAIGEVSRDITGRSLLRLPMAGR